MRPPKTLSLRFQKTALITPLKMNRPTVVYHTLTEKGSIRLLLLQPATAHDAELCATLLYTTLSECDYDLIAPYTALSYVWGEPSREGLIRINGNSVGITATLDTALRDMRDATRIRRIWADALCINQSDIPERNSQVSMMGQIYSIAQHTIIHLGGLTPAAEAVFKSAPKRSLGISSTAESAVLSEVIEDAKSDLLLHPWFRRVWIFQELVLSKDPWVQCGNKRIRWADFCSLLLPRPLPLPMAEDGLDSLRVVENMNNARLTLSPGNLSRLLQARRGFGATDPRDMIFAHLGLASDRPQAHKHIQVDYSKQVDVIYGQAARYLFDAVGLEELFSLAGDADSRSSKSKLPSWIPDWSLPLPNRTEMYKDNFINRLQLTGLSHAFIDDSRVLAIVGYKVGIINEISQTVPDAATVSKTLIEQWQRLESEVSAIYRVVGGIYYSGDSNGRYGHVSLSGREEEHAHLGNLLFQKFQEAITSLVPSEDLIPRNELPSFFQTWAQQAATSKRILVGRESQGLARLTHDYMHPKIKQKVLESRRLAETEERVCGVVPAHSQKGDLVVNLVGSEKAYVIRPVSLPTIDQTDIEKRIFNCLSQGNAKVQVAGRDELLWEPRKAGFTALPCVLIGECYFDGQVGWALNQRPTSLDVFALR